MKLKKVQITNFRSVEDSEVFEIDDLTCLVGKNEAGKSAILTALYGLRPYRKFSYDKTRDYPRRFLSKYDERHDDGESVVARTWWEMSDADIIEVEKVMGEGVVKGPSVEISAGIGIEGTKWSVEIDVPKVIEHACKSHRLDASERAQISGLDNIKKIIEKIKGLSVPTEKLTALKDYFEKFRKQSVVCKAIDILDSRTPRFFLTSHFDRMSGEISLDHLKATRDSGNEVSVGDRIFLDFIEYAGTTIEDLQDSNRSEELTGICEGASNDITDEIFRFWSQNDALSVKIDIGQGKPGDPAPFNKGTVAKIRIWNDHHRASVPLSERSAGFVWFFSFLAQFKQLSKSTGDVILLLDEPGLTLHGKAQSDLLVYIKERLLADHQVIYTTHSPFLIPASNLAQVRVVEDVVKHEKGKGRPEVIGTKVSAEVLSVDADTLFPLRGHLGYEITQSLFVGENTLLVEGPSDVLYIQAASQALKSRGKVGLDPRWVICPTGGIDKVQSFATLFSGNGLNIAVLTDIAKGDKGKLERLRQSQILASSQIFTMADFTAKEESDIEDFFEPSVFVLLLSKAYSLASGVLTEALLDGSAATTRQVKKAEAMFNVIPDIPVFDHFTPASYLIRNPSFLDGDEPDLIHSLERFEAAFVALNQLVR